MSLNKNLYKYLINNIKEERKNMSQRGRARRAAYKARQEEQGKKVVKWLFIVLVVLAICFIAFSIVNYM